VLQGGSATSVRLRGEPNAYNRIAVNDAGDIAIEGRIWDGKTWTDATLHPVQVMGRDDRAALAASGSVAPSTVRA
jgi:hypothetical protein